MPAINRIRMFFKLFALSEYCHSPYFADLIEIVKPSVPSGADLQSRDAVVYSQSQSLSQELVQR